MRAVAAACVSGLVLFATLAGCASNGQQAPEQESKVDFKLHVDINLDNKPTMKVTNLVTGVSVSTDDTCQAYSQSRPENAILYRFLACTHIAVLFGTAPAESKPPEPEGSLCPFLIAPDISPHMPDISPRMKGTMDSYCAGNPAQPIENAINLYWDESLKKGSFN